MATADGSGKPAVDTRSVYLGLRLAHPFMAGASPLSAHLDGVRRLEDAGAAAIVLHSLFEEQITEAESGRLHGIDPFDDPSLARHVEMFPPSNDYPFEPEEHVEHLYRVKQAVRVPVIASLNGTWRGTWLKHSHSRTKSRRCSMGDVSRHGIGTSRVGGCPGPGEQCYPCPWTDVMLPMSLD